MSIIPPIVDPILSEEAAHRLPSIKIALLMLSCTLKQRTAMELNVINQEAKRGNGDQHICQVFFSVAVVVPAISINFFIQLFQLLTKIDRKILR
ncbi:MAG: hypothetical protein OXC62_05135 [Aestuariivita sp.]|nr:hypothetical protein [Aestuariivita sp.]